MILNIVSREKKGKKRRERERERNSERERKRKREEKKKEAEKKEEKNCLISIDPGQSDDVTVETARVNNQYATLCVPLNRWTFYT